MKDDDLNTAAGLQRGCTHNAIYGASGRADSVMGRRLDEGRREDSDGEEVKDDDQRGRLGQKDEKDASAISSATSRDGFADQG